MSEEKKLLDPSDLAILEYVQKYVLGNKKDGSPRAIYDVAKDMMWGKKKKKEESEGSYSLYSKWRKKKKKKNRGKKNKYRYITW
jgi:hypothetical protein